MKRISMTLASLLILAVCVEARNNKWASTRERHLKGKVHVLLSSCGDMNFRYRGTRPRANKQSNKRSVDKVAARREAIHKMMLKGEYQHDGSSELVYIGDISSVPALLQVLKDNPSTRMPDGSLIGTCTAAHAYEALVKITGNKESKTYDEWSAWWEQYQKEHPLKLPSNGWTAPPISVSPKD